MYAAFLKGGNVLILTRRPNETLMIGSEITVVVPSLMGDLAMGSLRLLWRLIRLPIWTCLVILQPVVGLVFGGLALLGVLMSFFFKLSGAAPHFPFLIMLAISVGFGLVLIGYEALVRCFSR